MSERAGILLVGGFGTRLQPMTFTTPKPMLNVAGHPFTEHQIIKAREAGITQIVLATAFKAELFEPYFGDGSRFGISISYAVEKEPLGTGGAIANAAKFLRGGDDKDLQVAIFNGDVLSGHDLDKQFDFHREQNADISLYLTRVPDARAYGAVELDEENRVLAFNEKMENPPTNIINAGCYIFSKKSLELIPQDRVVSVERETFPQALASGTRVFGFVDDHYWLDIGTPAALLKASRDLLSGVAPSDLITTRAPYWAAADVKVASTSRIFGGSTIDREAEIGEGAIVENSMIGAGARIGNHVRLVRSFVAGGAYVPDGYIGEGIFFGFPIS